MHHLLAIFSPAAAACGDFAAVAAAAAARQQLWQLLLPLLLLQSAWHAPNASAYCAAHDDADDGDDDANDDDDDCRASWHCAIAASYSVCPASSIVSCCPSERSFCTHVSPANSQAFCVSIQLQQTEREKNSERRNEIVIEFFIDLYNIQFKLSSMLYFQHISRSTYEILTAFQPILKYLSHRLYL